MAIHVALHHRTEYRYDRPVALGPQVVRLRPCLHSRTPILSYSLKVQPKQHFLNWQQDPQANYLARFVFPEKTDHFTVEVDLVAEVAVINPFDFFLEPWAEEFPFAYPEAMAKELAPYLIREPAGPLLSALLAAVDMTPRRTVGFLVELNASIQKRVGYVIRMEPGVQTPEETLSLAKGSCRDSAWLLVQALRHLGLAARFVSGYLIQLVPDEKPLEGPTGPEADFTDLHAWTEVYLPGAGWVGLDPTSGLFAGEGHIPLACSPDPQSASPVSGGLEPCEVTFDHAMKVTRIREAPRVTKPYTAPQWGQIEALGHKVDTDLVAGDVRLTQGGEPTFVSIDDRDGAEWATTALGPTKRGLAGDLLMRLRDRFAPGGFLHFGQGKWYPGESLPRWALTVFWRKDGDALWIHADAQADERKDYGFGPAEAERFIRRLSTRLGIDPDLVRGTFEDPWHYIRREQLLPANVDPFDSKLEDAEERARLAKVFQRGLETPVGFALPLERRHEAHGPVWLATTWAMRQEKLLLAPGDSPIGYRLPLGSLPWVDPRDYPFAFEQDPFEAREPLPPHPLAQAVREPPKAEPKRRLDPAILARMVREVPKPGENAWWVVRTALCIEPRDGRLYAFMPPMAYLEDYLALLAEIEATAVVEDLPVMIEGYPPPRDPRLGSIAVTPDPGVIEVNIHPSAGWTDLVQTTTALYEDARLSRLSTEKFMLDGRHVGTGGGNHIVVGGATPADSPFLRRPDLLRSIVTYWQNHPALSYVFSGLFIGPTSQAPRIDEARHDTLYEMEIAFRQLEKAGDAPPSWLVDRVFRHLLTDMQGNTHRSEICIDKLYSPDTSTGRLGLVEFRGFEMPPHAQMSLVQQLLLRALIARFWARPYRNRLVRWGTELQDRFMLPHFLELDLMDVVEDMREQGYAFDPAWFRPHLEFRFPLIGSIAQRGLTLELRHALEPWHVLGEEPGGGGTVRYVDSSVERLQVRVTGMPGERYIVACNGRRVPLHPTGVEGEGVAGVRFRAWQPPNCLHPTIPVHGPLVFDVIDAWSGRSVGGCTYHVAHPGGRNYDTAPVNANEAEARRLARFFPFGHTPGTIALPPETRSAEFPMTLDLRRD